MADRLDGDRRNENADPPTWRIESAHLRQPPDFVIIGTQRGGTTSLYRYLTGHPEIAPATRKEIHFFDHNYHKGMDWYLAHFPERGETPMVGEASPYYLYHPAAPERLNHHLPEAKLIALLRNPVDRAYSHHQMNVRRGTETLSFEEAIAAEPTRLRPDDDPSGLASRHWSYLARGCYADQLERWFRVVRRDRLLILRSEDLFQEPNRVLQTVLSFLGRPGWRPPEFKAFHHHTGYAAPAPATRARLRAYFAPANQRLYALLDRDLGWEREA